MTIILRKQKIFFASVPKIACTSIKRFFFEIENNRSFQGSVINGSNWSIHQFYRSRLFENFPKPEVLDNMYRTTLVRDPLRRFLSAYSNRAVFHGELSEKKAGANLKALGLMPDPDIHTFIENFAGYREAQTSIMHHTRPMTEFLGKDPGLYHRVYDISEIEDFRQDILGRLNVDVQMPHAQTGGPKIDSATLSSDEISKIKAFYEEDYDIFGAYLKS